MCSTFTPVDIVAADLCVPCVQVEAENSALRNQYDAAQPALQVAAADIAACKALIEKVRGTETHGFLSAPLLLCAAHPLMDALFSLFFQTATTCERWRAANA
jgi:hypothetical protein